ncbi:MAG: GGDEF domain-containing protein [Hoeflea sp.]|uniref:GGDEF domain-containing protein n=1 Tax=Hoeflea sp. TaxID=1940281 RepID=UPI0027318C93|nr:GGDEF domain-containing protein [Hoeflea sp.]MDP2122514.1 GGDEF domain-containing protein [Hoeflea sp.]
MAKLNRRDLVDVDFFPCGCLVTTMDRKLLFANQYFREYLDWDPVSLIDQTINVVFSRASQLFCESFVIPTTMQHGRCSEILLYLLNARGEQVPMLANVRWAPNGTLTWVFVEADNRNKLLQKLETTRYALEEQRDQLDQMSRTDPLTGVANRRELEAVLERMFKEAERSDLPVSVLMMDVDKFKSINDSYGHDAGDRVLCRLAKVLQSVCRETDIVARLGGDEFVCVLHDTDLSGAQVLADRILSAVSKSADGPCAYTVSIGISGRTRLSSARSGDVLKFADKALYDAKVGGRDRTAAQWPAYTH